MQTQAIRRVSALAALLLLAGCGTTDQKTAQQRPIEGTVHLCSSCHGMEGRSIQPTFPNLAGQQAEYLENQLLAFRDHSRADPHAHTYMWGMAAHLDDQTIHGVAAYYASQRPAAGEPASPEAARAGAVIFTQGVERREVPACAGCHGDHAEGQGPYPRLAGQHASYLTDQLHHFRTNARANETMHQNALNLTEEEIAALSAYLSSL